MELRWYIERMAGADKHHPYESKPVLQYRMMMDTQKEFIGIGWITNKEWSEWRGVSTVYEDIPEVK